MRVGAAALFLAGPLLICGGLLSAWAQNATAKPPAGQIEQQGPGTGPPAPVGHRQPQAKEAPVEMPPADQATRDLDKALAKKLTICRGC